MDGPGRPGRCVDFRAGVIILESSRVRACHGQTVLFVVFRQRRFCSRGSRCCRVAVALLSRWMLLPAASGRKKGKPFFWVILWLLAVHTSNTVAFRGRCGWSGLLGKTPTPQLCTRYNTTFYSTTQQLKSVRVYLRLPLARQSLGCTQHVYTQVFETILE